MRLPAFLFRRYRPTVEELRLRAQAADLDARLAKRKVGRPALRDRALKSARTRQRHDLAKDPLLNEMVAL